MSSSRSAPDSVVSVGVVGAGRIGRLHVENLIHRVPGAGLVAVADPRLDRDWAAALGIERTFASADEMLRDDAIQALIVAAPTPEHAAMIEKAAAAGKDVFCEKPVALDPATIDRVQAVAERHGVLVQVGFNRRFDPHLRGLRERVAAGEVGAVELVRVTNRDPALPPLEFLATSGGLFLDFTVHDFDTLRYVTGSEIGELQVFAAALVDPGVARIGDVDTAVLSLRLANGALATIDNSRQAHFYDQRIEVFGAAGSLEMGNVAATSVLARTAAGLRRDPPPHSFVERYAAAYVAELRAFVRAVRTREAPSPGLADTRAAVAAALAARTALEEGRRVTLSRETT